jgi:hypothetical protein
VTATPILVLGAGQRCGSTLLQRLLCSHPDVFIWGEHDGGLRDLLSVGARLRRWSDGPGRRGRDLFDRGGYQSFMANMTPGEEPIDAALRAFVEALFAEPARARGRSVWGFKEVRYGAAEIAGLHRLFPGLAVVFVIRDPRDVLRSLDEWERLAGPEARAYTEEAVGFWRDVGSDLLAFSEVPVLRLRYEDVVADRTGTAELIGKHTGLDPGRFDMAVFANRVPGGPPREGRVPRPWADLPDAMRQLLDSAEIHRVAAAYGYHL